MRILQYDEAKKKLFEALGSGHCDIQNILGGFFEKDSKKWTAYRFNDGRLEVKEVATMDDAQKYVKELP